VGKLRSFFLLLLVTAVICSNGGLANAAPEPTSNSKILFTTDKYDHWQWHKERYPDSMAYGVSFSEVDGSTSSRKLVLIAKLGSCPTGGYGIGIANVTLKGDQMTVQVRMKSPAPDRIVTMAITNPSDNVQLDLNSVKIPATVNIRFVDNKDALLWQDRFTTPTITFNNTAGESI
jgi:hypothetical protein